MQTKNQVWWQIEWASIGTRIKVDANGEGLRWHSSLKAPDLSDSYTR